MRNVETGAGLQSGQADAGPQRADANPHRGLRRGVPWVGELPYLGVLFRKVEEHSNEIELLVLVTPEIVRRRGEPVLEH